MWRCFLVLLTAAWASAQVIPGAGLWQLQGDPAQQMIAGMERYLGRLYGEAPAKRNPAADRLRQILGAGDERVPARRIIHTDRLGQTGHWSAYAAHWPVLDRVRAEGLHYVPKIARKGCVVAIPDAERQPEALLAAQQFAAAGYEVLVPTLIDLGTAYSGNPAVRMSQWPHREWIYRMAFPVGRHPYGYELQKVLAAVDYFASAGCSASVYGEGEGGRVALFAAVLDSRIPAVEAHDASIEPLSLRDQPVHRNVFGLLRDFGDAELRTMLGARWKQLPRASAEWVRLNEPDPQGRMLGQVREIEDHVQRLVRASRRYRDELWSQVKGNGPDEWRRNAEPLAQRFLHESVGVLPGPRVPLDLRAKQSYGNAKWQGWDVQFQVRPEFFGYGVLLVPRDLKPGEKRPLVVVQHGLQGTPQHLFGQTEGKTKETYRNFAAQLAELGFVVYAPQNPYTGDFRHIAKLANPLGLSLYSFIREQYAVMLDWLSALPFVDAERIGYYGLSYGGRTAMMAPPFEPRFRAVISGGNFNEWIGKLTTADEPWSYMYAPEYEIFDWNIAHVASHAELAMLIAPRPFLVERGHRDGVGIDEWVAAEYARVRRFYAEAGIGDRTEIAYFHGPHRVDGPAAIAFLRRHLRH